MGSFFSKKPFSEYTDNELDNYIQKKKDNISKLNKELTSIKDEKKTETLNKRIIRLNKVLSKAQNEKIRRADQQQQQQQQQKVTPPKIKI